MISLSPSRHIPMVKLSQCTNLRHTYYDKCFAHFYIFYVYYVTDSISVMIYGRWTDSISVMIYGRWIYMYEWINEQCGGWRYRPALPLASRQPLHKGLGGASELVRALWRGERLLFARNHIMNFVYIHINTFLWSNISATHHNISKSNINVIIKVNYKTFKISWLVW